MQSAGSTLILGIGNILRADAGFGVRAVEAMHRQYRFPENVTLMDGGAQGIYLVQHIQSADIVVVFDAVDYGLPPGTLTVIEGDDVPTFLGAKKISLHQTGFQEVLAMAEMLGSYPSRILLVGVQPVQLEDFGGSLGPAVKAQIQPAIDAALSWLGRLGVKAVVRDQPLSNQQSIAGAEIDMLRYEGQRPSASEACRIGDERVLVLDQYTVTPRPYPLESDALIVDVDHRGKY